MRDRIRHPGGVIAALRRNRRRFIMSGCILSACTLLLIAMNSSITPTTFSSVSAQEESRLTTVAEKSTGCGKPSPVAPGTSVTQTLSSGGIDRSYLLHIPTGYKDTVEQPLVLNFHGHGSNASQQQYRTGFSQLANAYDFIVAYPQGAIGPDHRTGWDTGPRRDPHTNDVLFVSNLLTHLEESWCINPERIYATGFSNGGGMTYVLACKMADRFAAVASVSGSYPPVPGGCNPARPVPIMELHGTADRTVPYNGSSAKGYPPITQWLQQWAERDGCDRRPVTFFNEGNVTGERWVGCRDNVTIIHYTIDGMGHMWPRHLIIRTRNGAVPFDATNLIWSFFQSYRLPATRAGT
ncbi:MAG TPA: PHB depolymerase family esterase [Ktedonobacteraceae bacterium]|nr:PHB depolymerase family esterase [Ktedonobacteraceae bacterium]